MAKHRSGNKNCETEMNSVSNEALGEDEQVDYEQPWLKYRYIVAFLGMIIFFFLTSYRINTSVTIVAMIKSSDVSEQTDTISDSCPELLANTTKGNNSTERERDTEEGEFDWSPELQGYILASYFLSFLVVQIPFGKLVERYGCKWFLFWGTILSAVGTLAIPLASRLHPYAFIAIQIIRGIGHGFYQPACPLLIANWIPNMERGLIYAFIQSGNSLGAFLGSIFSGLLCKSTTLGGWTSSFYAFGIAGLVLAVSIAYLVHENPRVHPKISKAELKYILSNQENVLEQRRPNPPWGKILKSVPVYALAIGIFGQFWAQAQFLIVHSTFLGAIMHYPIKENGFFSAVPFLLMFLCTQISSWLSTLMTTRKYASVDRTRKFWNFLASLGYSVCLLGVYFVGCNRSWSIVFSILSMGFLGFGMSGSWIVPADMSPTFVASLNSITVTFAALSSFILPVIVGHLTNEMQTIEQWNKVFFVTIGVVMTSGIIFSVFGSANIQPWNYPENDSKQGRDESTRPED